jgi:hypothetical protein
MLLAISPATENKSQKMIAHTQAPFKHKIICCAYFHPASGHMKAKELLQLNKAQIEHPGQLRATWSFSG